MDALFFSNMDECPWYENGECKGTKDTCYDGDFDTTEIEQTECDYCNCPVFHWVEVIMKEIEHASNT